MARADKRRVFLVEDDFTLSSLIKLGLTQAGYEVIIANDGLSAQEKLAEVNPDLIILDLYIPGLDGLDFLDWVREQGLTTPVLVISAADLKQEEVLRRGADGFLNKPVQLDTIAEKVGQFLAGAS